MIQFTVYGDAKAAGSKRGFLVKGRVQIVDSNRNSKPWKQEVAAAAAEAMRDAGLPLYTGALAVRFDFYVTRPRGHFGKRGLLPSARPYPSVKPDVLKTARGVEDGMTGVVWVDDALIVDEHIRKLYGEPARVEIAVWEMPLTTPQAIGSTPPNERTLA